MSPCGSRGVHNFANVEMFGQLAESSIPVETSRNASASSSISERFIRKAEAPAASAWPRESGSRKH